MDRGPDAQRAAAEQGRSGARALIDSATRDCLVTGYEPFIETLSLPDPNDRHVLAAATVGRCDVIVTANGKDLPAAILLPLGIGVQHPDEFLRNHLTLAPGVVCGAIRKVRARLRKPPYSVREYLSLLTRQGLVATVRQLDQFVDLL